VNTRDQYAAFVSITTRWSDNDQYGHVNNVVYYSYFDTAVNQLLIERQLLDPVAGALIGLVVQSQCEFAAALSFPIAIDAGVRVAHIGRTSVRYEIGLFEAGKMQAAAHGHFVHVYVDRHTRQPAPLPAQWRAQLQMWTLE
jgi:acyl-CoA thioester hydrolase